MRLPSLLRSLPTLAVLAAMLLLAACDQYAPRSSAVEEKIAGTSFEPPASRRVAQQQSTLPASDVPAGSARPQVFLNEGNLRAKENEEVERVADGVQINFDGAELREVVKVILGDILGVTYTLDPTLTGQVVLSSSGPLNDQQLLGVLETALQMHGAGLSRNPDGSYAVLLQDMARGLSEITPLGGSSPPHATPGTGVTIVPLRYIGAMAAAQFVQPLLTRPDQIRTDDNRNLLLFVGSSGERQAVLDTLSEIDVNWMAGRSVGIFPLKMASPEAVIPELEALVNPLSGNQTASETVRFMPMSRLNAVLVIASQPEQVVEVQRWVTRLDRGNVVGIQFFVYQLQHVPAAEVAEILNQTFSTYEPSAASSPSTATTIQPHVPELAGPIDATDAPGGDTAPAGVDVTAADDIAGDMSSGDTRAQIGPNLLQGVKIVANPLNNTLLIRATPQAYDMIEQTVRRLDQPPLQVLIEATIAEVTLNDRLRYGVQYYLNTGSVKAGFNTTTPTSSGVIDPNLLNPLAQLPGFNFVMTPGSSNVTIDALSRITDVKVLSSPSIVVQDNSEAVLNVGDEVPITTRSAVSVDDTNAPVVNNIEYRDTGVILEVKPRISSNDIVALEVAQEVSRVASETTSSDSLTPTISQRKITSRINVQSGQTVVLGGLIQDSESRSNNKVPLLGDIPAVGELFQSTDNQASRTELIVFITPQIIRNAEDAKNVSEELRARMRSMRPLPVDGADGMGRPLDADPQPLMQQPGPAVSVAPSSGYSAGDRGTGETVPQNGTVPVASDMPTPSVRPVTGHVFVPRSRPRG